MEVVLRSHSHCPGPSGILSLIESFVSTESRESLVFSKETHDPLGLPRRRQHPPRRGPADVRQLPGTCRGGPESPAGGDVRTSPSRTRGASLVGFGLALV